MAVSVTTAPKAVRRVLETNKTKRRRVGSSRRRILSIVGRSVRSQRWLLIGVLTLAGLAPARTAGASAPTLRGWTEALPASTTIFEATLSVPTYPMVSTDISAWLKALSPSGSYVQVGWETSTKIATLVPTLFAQYWPQPADLSGLPPSTYGPALAYGQRQTVRIVRLADEYTAEWWGDPNGTSPHWVTTVAVTLQGSVRWEAYVEDYGAPEQVCFAGRQYFTAGWFALPGGCQV